MFKDRFLDALKSKKNDEKLDNEMAKAMTKIQKQKRLSSQEFLKVYDSLWREGPATSYQNPDARLREMQSLNQNPNP
jgi:hypothetical protein